MPAPMKLLIVEDNQKLAESLKEGFEHEGYAVDVLFDGETASRRILSGNCGCDLVILDVMLPSVDGIEFCASVRSQDGWDKFPIIMFSAKSDSQDVQRALDAGATEYISKPAPLKTMLSMIRKMLDMPQEPLQELLPDDQLSTE